MIPHYKDTAVELYFGDCRKILPQLSSTVSLVLTDPPYHREYLWTYSTIAEHASRLLPDGGFCFAYGGAEHLRERLSRMEEHLTFFWVHVLLHSGSNPRLWAKHIMSGYKPVLVYTKGKPNNPPWMNSVHNCSQDKVFHKWGQGVGFARKIIEMFTSIGDTILDPFCGGGQVLRAAKDLHRRAIGIEIDEVSIKATIDNLAQEVLRVSD